MKKYFFLILFFVQVNLLFSQNPPWVVTNDTSLMTYSFSSPGAPTSSDTLNIKHYFYALDTLIGFQVLEFKYAQLDSTNSLFISSLQQSSGDTLRAINNELLGTTNSILLSSQNFTLNNGLKGLDVYIKYNALNNGRVVVSYVRYYYKRNFLLTFTITGFQNNQSLLDTNKNLFFNSITF